VRETNFKKIKITIKKSKSKSKSKLNEIK